MIVTTEDGTQPFPVSKLNFCGILDLANIVTNDKSLLLQNRAYVDNDITAL